MRVARTVADLDAADAIGCGHISEANEHGCDAARGERPAPGRVRPTGFGWTPRARFWQTFDQV